MQIKGLSKEVSYILKNPPKDMKIINTWQFSGQKPHALQLAKNSIQPNGTKLNKILTIYGNDAITIETERTLPDGSKRYSIGTRFPNKSSKYYSSDVINSYCKTAQDKNFYGNPEAKKFNLEA
ncbi:hypothetical protein KBA27_02515 [bacterium]|nr:hypothetical protein [bacterium]